MTTTLTSQSTDADAAGPFSMPALLRRAMVGYWHEIARALVVGLVVLVCTTPPVIMALWGATSWLVGLTCLPLALALTGAASFAATIAHGNGVSARALARVDPVLAVLGTLLVVAAGAAFAGPGPLPLVGAALAALLLLVAPSVLAYGALRERRGLGALRGGLILVAYRPSWALSQLALACIGGFAIVASAGVLIVIVPVASLLICCTLVTALLREIDGTQNNLPDGSIDVAPVRTVGNRPETEVEPSDSPRVESVARPDGSAHAPEPGAS